MDRPDGDASHRDNGTMYVDDHFKKTLLKGREHATRYPGLQRVYRRVKDTVGTTLLSMSVPGYRRWKESLTPGDIFWLSSKCVRVLFTVPGRAY